MATRNQMREAIFGKLKSLFSKGKKPSKDIEKKIKSDPELKALYAKMIKDIDKTEKSTDDLMKKLGISSGKSSVFNISRKLNKNKNKKERQSDDEILANLKEMESRGEVYYDEEKGWRLTPAHKADLIKQQEESK